MQLSIDNLSEIYRKLAVSYNGAQKTLDLFDLNTILEPTNQNRATLNQMFSSMGGYLIEISHVDSFLNQSAHEKMTTEQREMLGECQELCKKIKEASKKVLDWIARSREKWNDAEISSEENDPVTRIIATEKASSDARVSDEMMDLYEQLRTDLKFFHGEVMFIDPENLVKYAGNDLKVMQGQKMFVETEHEMNVLMDYGLFQYRKNGKTVVQRYYDQNHSIYSDRKKFALDIYKDARFSFLTITKATNEHGVLVNDPMTGEDFLLIDRGLHQLAKSTVRPYALLTHYLQTPQFILTTGASVPVDLNCAVGKEMSKIFTKLVNHHRHDERLSISTYQECIKDLYRIAIHEDLVKKLSSRPLPMSYV